jgi:uncharacterized membrane protein YqjE
MSDPSARPGAFGAARAQIVTLLALGQTRLELLGNEIETGRLNAMRQFMLAQALLLSAGLAVVLTVAGLALVFWEQRVLVVVIAGALSWAFAVYFYIAMRQSAERKEHLFASSLAELQEDLRQLKASTGHGPAAD